MPILNARDRIATGLRNLLDALAGLLLGHPAPVPVRIPIRVDENRRRR